MGDSIRRVFWQFLPVKFNRNISQVGGGVKNKSQDTGEAVDKSPQDMGGIRDNAVIQRDSLPPAELVDNLS
jgi:hypothetical protein